MARPLAEINPAASTAPQHRAIGSDKPGLATGAIARNTQEKPFHNKHQK
jgi:hypothetical protein